MKVAFFFDTFLLKDDNNDFWGMTLTYDFFKNRYLSMFDQLTVSTRVKNKKDVKENIEGYRKSNGKNIKIEPITAYNNIFDAIKNKKKIEKQIDEIVKRNDKLIIRMPSVIGMFACNSAKKYNKKYLIEMVACPFDGYMNHVKIEGKLLAPIMYVLNKEYILNAPRVLYVTDSFLQKRYPTKGEQIACSDVVLVPRDKDILNDRINRIQKETNLTNLRFVTVASVGLKYKGQEYFIKAIPILERQGINVEYYLIGNGNDARLKKFVKKYKVESKVHFMGSLKHEEVFELLKGMDIYIQPSLQEGLPRALIEAMSMACPAIGSTAGGIPELLDKEYIFKKRKYKQICYIVKNLTIEKLQEQAINNYNKSLKFQKEILEQKRKEFYQNF